MSREAWPRNTKPRDGITWESYRRQIQRIAMLEAELADLRQRLAAKDNELQLDPGWATGICSAHQRPDPLCRICNPKIVRLEAEIAELRHDIERYVEQVSELASENTDLRRKIGELKGAHVDCFWHDCHVEGRRGADHCLFEGTHVCTFCTIADLRRQLAEKDQASWVAREEEIKKDAAIVGECGCSWCRLPRR